MFSFNSIKEYHSHLKNGSITCVQTVQHYLSAIDARQNLNAFVEVFKEEALERAQYLDAQGSFGKLHGVVLGIKDNICFKGHRASAGSRILGNFTSLYSSTAVERLIADTSSTLLARIPTWSKDEP